MLYNLPQIQYLVINCMKYSNAVIKLNKITISCHFFFQSSRNLKHTILLIANTYTSDALSNYQPQSATMLAKTPNKQQHNPSTMHFKDTFLHIDYTSNACKTNRIPEPM